MTSTTIKVPAELRDRLKKQAGQHQRTLAQHLEALVLEEARRERFRELQRATEARPADAAYLADAASWQDDAAWL